jgi:hypothetical protein
MIDFLINIEAHAWQNLFEFILFPLLVLWIWDKYDKKEKEKAAKLAEEEKAKKEELLREDTARAKLVAEKERLEEERHLSLLNQNERLIKKVSGYCEQNTKEHDELFTSRREAENRLTAIEEIHRQRGCNQPFQRRISEKRGRVV